MDDEAVETDVPTVGERLRAAREAKDLSLEDVAAQTRIPQRHLESLETADWDKLPHPTYTLGFAKSYASAVGLDRADVGEQLKAEMGGVRPTTQTAEVFEPADPARTMPKSLVFGAIGAVIILVIVMTWLNERSLSEGEDTNSAAAAEAPAQPARQPTAQQPSAPATVQGPVVLAATAPAWIQVTDQGKTLFSGQLSAGQSFTVPPNATAPMLKAGKPEALRVTVGTTVAPPVGPAGKVAANVSLLPADLLRTGQPTAAQSPAGAAPPPAQRPRATRPKAAAPATAAAPTVPPPAAPPPPATNATGE